MVNLQGSKPLQLLILRRLLGASCCSVYGTPTTCSPSFKTTPTMSQCLCVILASDVVLGVVILYLTKISGLQRLFRGFNELHFQYLTNVHKVTLTPVCGVEWAQTWQGCVNMPSDALFHYFQEPALGTGALKSNNPELTVAYYSLVNLLFLYGYWDASTSLTCKPFLLFWLTLKKFGSCRSIERV